MPALVMDCVVAADTIIARQGATCRTTRAATIVRVRPLNIHAQLRSRLQLLVTIDPRVLDHNLRADYSTTTLPVFLPVRRAAIRPTF